MLPRQHIRLSLSAVQLHVEESQSVKIYYEQFILVKIMDGLSPCLSCGLLELL